MQKFLKFSKWNFFIRILMPSFLTIILFVAVYFALFIPHFENTVLDRKREMIKELTNSAWSIIDKWHRAEKSGSISKEKAQEMAMSQIESMRYGEGAKDYFWITDYSPTMIMHPYRTDLNNKDLKGFSDLRGKKLFIEMADKAKKEGEGFVNYMWQWKNDSTKIVSKLSYVKAFAPWQWIVGTGIYIEDVKQEIALLETKIINASIAITLAISVLLFFIVYQNLLSEKKRMIAENNLQESKEKYRALVEASTEGLIMVLEGGQIFYNKTLYHILGYTEATPSLLFPEIFVKPPKLKSVDTTSLKISPMLNDEIDQAEAELRRADGSHISVLINVSPISFLGNSGVVLSVKDISLNKKIEAELGQSKEKYLALTNKLSIGVFSAYAARGCRFIDSNNAILKLFEIAGNDALKETNLSEYFENVHEFDSFYNGLVEQQSIQNRFITLRKSSGLQSAASISAVLVNDENGKPEFIEGVIEDISAQSKSNMERDALIQELLSPFLFLNNSIEMFVKPVLTCGYDMPVKDALFYLLNEKSNCLLIEDNEHKALGFLTISDISQRILVSDLNKQKRVYEFMSSPLITIEPFAPVFEALVKYHKNRIAHLLYKNNQNQITGVVDLSDIQKHSHLSYLFFVQKIQSAHSVSELSVLNEQLMFLIRGLIEKQIDIKDTAKLLTTISDALIKKAINLAVEKLGPPPVDFSFIVLGSSGRSEQTMATDQDNAIVYADVDPIVSHTTSQYFLKLGEIVTDDLNRIGYNFCKGEIMAKNPKWCQPVSIWKSYFTDWVTTATPQNLLDTKIFFDLRHIYGEEKLIDELQNHISSLTAGYNSFYVYLSESIIQFQLPEGSLKLKMPFDIKLVMLPVVDTIRLYALRAKCTSTNTIRRLEFIYEKGVLSKHSYKNILHVYTFLMQKRLEHQSIALTTKLKADNQINPLEFSDLEIVIIKKSLLIIEELQSKLKLDFRGTLSI